MYDKVILKHYANVAAEEGNLDSCTMADEKIRQIETFFILEELEKILKNYNNKCPNKKPVILDVGCGNGYTLSQINQKFQNILLKGIEFTPELRVLANDRNLPCYIESGDIRVKNSMPSMVDIIICQRVLINLLDLSDQKLAVNNLMENLETGGYFIAIEAFNSGLNNLNTCREELGLKSLLPAHHNLYLDEDFFNEFPDLISIATTHGPDILSTHYFISRILHDLALNSTGTQFVRNSLFSKFFDEALPLGVGQFSPLKCLIFKKK